MASIIYQTNRKTGHIYAFRSESYRDPITKKPRSKRTYLGRYDPETDRIIPKAETARRNRATYASEEEYASILDDLQQKLKQQENLVKAQQGELEMVRLRNNQLQEVIAQISKVISRIS